MSIVSISTLTHKQCLLCFRDVAAAAILHNMSIMSIMTKFKHCCVKITSQYTYIHTAPPICQTHHKILCSCLKCGFIVISVKPTSVHILTKEKFVSADKQYDIECVSTGSKPSAVITWYRGSKPLKRFVKNVSTHILILKNKPSQLTI